MKVKIDRHDINVLINGLYSTRGNYSGEQLEMIEHLILKLIDASEAMKPRGKRKICFELEEIRMTRRCLIDWRNAFLSAGQEGAAQGIAEVLIRIV